MSLSEFNAAERAAARATITPCLDVPRWVDAVVDARPYADVEAALAVAGAAADPLTEDELRAALAHHPRIGERAAGDSAEAGLSRSEQAGLAADDDIQRRLREGNRAYEERFDRVFLIRAAGRTSEEILRALDERLGHDDATELAVVADQLRQIALLRLTQALADDAPRTGDQS